MPKVRTLSEAPKKRENNMHPLQQRQEWAEKQGRRFCALKISWPDVMVDQFGDRNLDFCVRDTSDNHEYPDFLDGPTEDSLPGIVREKFNGFRVAFITDGKACCVQVTSVMGGVVFKSEIRGNLTEACLDSLEFAKNQKETTW